MLHFGWVESEDGWSVSDVATGLQNFLICVELLGIVIVQARAFGYQSWEGEGLESPVVPPTVMQSFVHAANPADICYDTFIALKKGPQRHVVVGRFLELSREDQLKHGQMPFLFC
jgi:hypothetical protein